MTLVIFRMVLDWATVDESSHHSEDSILTVASALVCVCVGGRQLLYREACCFDICIS